MNEQVIERIPIAQIRIANPRQRNQAKWLMIVASIKEVGLKKPITVLRLPEPDEDGHCFDLVCGQGRIEAFQFLGETTIPAVITDVRREDQFLMSLIENIARRPPSSRAILYEVRNLRERGYTNTDIAKKLGMDRKYIAGIAHLVEHDEVSLVEAVEAGRLPVSIAVEIASGNDQEVSRAMTEAYESGALRGSKLGAVRRLMAERIAKRQKEGKAEQAQRKVTGATLVKVYKQRVREQKELIAKADRVKERLALVTSAVRQLLADENFATLLRAESIPDMPAQLMARLD
jgi:ParB family transcriptional regulator, chromosome partitioning protein